MIDCCLFYNSDGTITVTIHFSFYIQCMCSRKFVGDKGSRREEGNRELVYYYQDQDGTGNGNGNCWARGWEKDWKDGFVFIHFFHYWYPKLLMQKWTEVEGRQIVSCCLILLLFFVSPFSMQVNWFPLSSSHLLDSYLLQDFSSSPDLVITFLFGNIVWESAVANHCIGHWHETGLQTF